MNESIAILGAGLAGLILGSELHKKGIPFKIYEKDSIPGGLARTATLGDFKYDHGAHRFHNRNAHLEQWLRKLLNGHVIEVNKRSAISKFDRLIEFPLSPVNLLKEIPLARSFSYIKDWQQRPRQSGRNLKDHAINRFGSSLAQDFVLDYSIKLWGIDPSELSKELGSVRLKSLNLATAVKELFLKTDKCNQHIDGKFLYPIGGFGEIPKALLSQMDANSVLLNCQVQELKDKGSHFAVKTNQGTFKHHKVVNTLSLDLFMKFLGKDTTDIQNTFNYRELYSIFLTLNQQEVSPHVSLYFPDTHSTLTRAHEPKNRWQGMAPEGKTSLLLELPFDTQLNPPQYLKKEAIKTLVDKGLIEKQNIIDIEVRHLPKAYPVITNKCLPLRKKILTALDKDSRLFTLGRNARLSYQHCHDIYNDACSLAEELCLPHRKTKILEQLIFS